MIAPFIIGTAQHELLRNDGSYQADGNQPLRMRIRQAAKQDAIHDAKHRCGRADAEHQREHHRDCESRSTAKSAQRISHVFHKDFNAMTWLLGSTLLACALNPAERNRGMSAAPAPATCPLQYSHSPADRDGTAVPRQLRRVFFRAAESVNVTEILSASQPPTPASAPVKWHS